MKINMDRLLDLMMEYENDNHDYYYFGAKYRQEHGHGIYMYSGKELTAEEQHLEYLMHASEKGSHAIWAVLDVIGYDNEQRERFYSVFRAVKRWYEKETQWQRLLPEDLLEKIERYIVGQSA